MTRKTPLILLTVCLLTNTSIVYGQQFANTSHEHQGHKHDCMDENCLHQHQAASAPVVSSYNFPDSTITDVIDVSIVPVITSPQAEVFLQQQKIAPMSQTASASNAEGGCHDISIIN